MLTLYIPIDMDDPYSYFIHLQRYAILRQAMHVEPRIEWYSCNHCCCVKAISTTYSKCVFVALCIQCVTHLRHTVIVVSPALLYFSTLSQNGTTSEKSSRIQKVFYNFLYYFCENYFSF